MKTLRCLVILLALAPLAQAELPNELARAVQPMTEGVPQVAAVRLREFLATNPPEEERRAAILKLGQALVAAEEPDDALPILDDAAVRNSAEAKFYRAQALAALTRWSEALPLYEQSAAETKPPFQSDALFGEAEALRALGRGDEALPILNSLQRDSRWNTRARFSAVEILLAKNDVAEAQRLIDSINPKSDSERRERRLLGGRVVWESNRPQRAINMFASILKAPRGATHAVLLATLFAISDAHLQLGTPESGDDFLEEYIEHHPTDSELPAIFAKLDQLYAAERRQSRHDLGRWSHETAQPRRALAQWYLARAELRMGHREAALQAFAQLRAQHPALPELAEPLNEYAQLKLQDGDPAEAEAILEIARAMRPTGETQERLGFTTGKAEYAARQFTKAAQTFREVAQNAGPVTARDALFNASLAWLQANDAPQAAAAEQDLKQRGADAQTQGDLALEKALEEAARGESNATEALMKFTRENPKHARAAEAWVALAELAFHAAPPRLEEARQDLARAAEAPPSPAAAERADYLRIWIEEASAPPNDSRAIELANEFIRKYSSSSLLPEVRLKLAEIYYRRQDFASAQTQFEILAQKNAHSPVAEKAQFFAAESAMRSMGQGALERALSLFDEVVKGNGELKWAARNEQAVIERKLGKPQDAMTLYDEVLKGDAKPPEKREALCGKGDIFYELGAGERENYRRAIEAYTQLANERDVPPHWKNQALFKKGMCLERLEEPAEALTTFYSVMEDGGRPDRRREFFWFYKAGFNAARILEEQSKWQPAAAIYEKLAFAGGTRSEEAKSRLNRLRLEHFLWEQ